MIAMRSRNVPALRLEGFDGEWELKAIGDLSGRTYGGGTPSSDEPGYWSGDIPWIQSSDVAEQGVAPVAPRKHITREAISRSAAMQIPADSVAVVTRVGVGKVSFMPFPYATSQDFVSLSDLSGDPEYIALTVKRRMEGLADQLQGSTIKGITKTELLNQAVYFPPTLEEQQAIGAIFTNLDAAINQHTKKHQALQQAKTALMQRMFPQEEGQTVPELRLDGFDGEWESTTVDAVANVVGGGTPSTSNPSFWDGDIDWYSPNEVGSDIVAKPSNRRITSEGLHASSAQLLPAHRTILYTSRASIGHTAILEHPATTNQGFQSLVLRSGMDTYFVYSLTPLITRKAIKIASGSTFLEISAKALGSIEIPIPPTLEEQQAIGAVFTRLDTLISTEAKCIESLKQTKTALLQQMFI